MTDIRGKVLDLPEAPSGQGLYLNYPHMGYYDNSEFKAFISASGAFLFKSEVPSLLIAPPYLALLPEISE